MREQARGRVPVTGATSFAAVILMFSSALVASGCGGGSSGAEEAADATTTSEPTPTTEPPATDADAVRPLVEDRLARLDDVLDRIVRDPSLVLEEDAPVLEELAAIHAPGEAYDTRLSTYRENAETGRHLEPINGRRTVTTALTGELTVLDHDQVQGSLCIIRSYRVIDGSGALREIVDGLTQRGRVTAVRKDGVWKILRIDVDDSQVCDPGQAG